jgi:hypothetical protein
MCDSGIRGVGCGAWDREVVAVRCAADAKLRRRGLTRVGLCVVGVGAGGSGSSQGTSAPGGRSFGSWPCVAARWCGVPRRLGSAGTGPGVPVRSGTPGLRSLVLAPLPWLRGCGWRLKVVGVVSGGLPSLPSLVAVSLPSLGVSGRRQIYRRFDKAAGWPKVWRVGRCPYSGRWQLSTHVGAGVRWRTVGTCHAWRPGLMLYVASIARRRAGTVTIGVGHLACPPLALSMSHRQRSRLAVPPGLGRRLSLTSSTRSRYADAATTDERPPVRGGERDRLTILPADPPPSHTIGL